MKNCELLVLGFELVIDNVLYKLNVFNENLFLKVLL